HQISFQKTHLTRQHQEFDWHERPDIHRMRSRYSRNKPPKYMHAALSLTHSSGQRSNDLAIGSLRESLQAARAYVAAHAELQHETRQHRIVRRLAYRHHVVFPHGEVER